MVHLRPYNAATVVRLPIRTLMADKFLGQVPALGMVRYRLDGGAVQDVPLAQLSVVAGGRLVDLAIPAAWLQGQALVVTWQDDTNATPVLLAGEMRVETYGHAGAMHPQVGVALAAVPTAAAIATAVVGHATIVELAADAEAARAGVAALQADVADGVTLTGAERTAIAGAVAAHATVTELAADAEAARAGMVALQADLADGVALSAEERAAVAAAAAGAVAGHATVGELAADAEAARVAAVAAAESATTMAAALAALDETLAGLPALTITALKADVEWQELVADAVGDYVIAPPAVPANGTQTVTVKRRNSAATSHTVQLSYDAQRQQAARTRV